MDTKYSPNEADLLEFLLRDTPEDEKEELLGRNITEHMHQLESYDIQKKAFDRLAQKKPKIDL